MSFVTLHYTNDKDLEAQRIASFFSEWYYLWNSGETPEKIILQLLDASCQPEDMDLPGMRFHTLKGDLKNHYSVTVNGNWRIIFAFEGKDAILVDYLDYH